MNFFSIMLLWLLFVSGVVCRYGKHDNAVIVDNLPAIPTLVVSASVVAVGLSCLVC